MDGTARGAGHGGEATARQGAAPRLYQQAEEVVRRMILTGGLAPGTRLSETGLAARLGTSRAPARRALAALEAHGLVEKAAGRGWLVRPVESSPEAGGSGRPAPSVRLAPPATWTRILGAVEEEIVARIALGSWRLNEAEMARHHGVSRTVARDVAARLQQRGLLRKDERSRWVAPALSPRRVRELYEVRAILEPAALRTAARNAPRPLLEAMRDDLSAALGDPDAADGAVLDRLEEALHVTFLGHCGNEALMEAILAPQSLLIAHRFLYRRTHRLYRVEPFLSEHAEIVDRLLAGEVAGAAAALERHLVGSSARAIERVRTVAGTSAAPPIGYLHPL